MPIRIFFLALLLSVSSIVAQQFGTTNQRLRSLETGFNPVQKDSIQALIDARVGADTVVYGSATINVGADSVIVTHGLSSTPLITQLIAKPQGDAFGYDCWIQDITSTTFKIKIGGTGYVALTSALTINWYAFNASVAVSPDSHDYLRLSDYGSTSANLLSAITDAYGLNKPLHIAAGTYTMDANVQFEPSDTLRNVVEIIGQGKVVLDWSEATNLYPMTIRGNVGTDYALDSNLTLGDSVLYTSAPVRVGDILYILSTEDWDSAGFANKGEYCKVRRVIGTKIVLSEPLYDDYDKTTTNVSIVYAPKVIIKNIEIIGNEDILAQFGLILDFCRDVDVRNVTIRNTQTQAISIQNCYSGLVDNVNTYNTRKDGLGYGIGVSGSQNIVVQNSSFLAARHGMTGGGMAIISRNLKFVNNTAGCADGHFAAIDMHQSAEFVEYRGNTALGGGFGVHCRNFVLDNNTIILDKEYSEGIKSNVWGTKGRKKDYIQITNNKILNPQRLIGVSGLIILFYTDYDTLETVKLSENIFDVTREAFKVTASNLAYTHNSIKHISIDGDIYKVANENTGRYAIHLDNRFYYDKIRMNNVYVDSDTLGAFIAITGTVKSNLLEISNSYFKSPLATFQTQTANYFNEINITNTTFDGGEFSGTSNYIYADLIKIKDCTFKNYLYNDGLIVNGVTSYLVDNIYQNTGGVVSNTATTEILGWLESSGDTSASSYTKLEMQTSGDAILHSDNLSNWNVLKTTTDSTYLNRLVDYTITYTDTVSRSGLDGDTLIIRIYPEVAVEFNNAGILSGGNLDLYWIEKDYSARFSKLNAQFVVSNYQQKTLPDSAEYLDTIGVFQSVMPYPLLDIELLSKDYYEIYVVNNHDDAVKPRLVFYGLNNISSITLSRK